MIVGFPGETDEEFAESLAFAGEQAFAKVHVFPYSVRRGTRAAEMPEAVPPAVKKERAEAMGEIARAAERTFWKGHLETTVDVLWETRKNGVWQGLTDNYLRVLAASPAELANRVTAARVTGLAHHGVRAEVLAPLRGDGLGLTDALGAAGAA